MAISTLRPDGWPQTTIVGYANAGFLIYFMIFRSSQKFANIERDDRISFAIGEEPRTIGQLEALYANAHASEVTELGEREIAWRLLKQRHPNLADFDLPGTSDAAMMRGRCEHVSVLDFTKGSGQVEELTVGEDGRAIKRDATVDAWSSSTAARK